MKKAVKKKWLKALRSGDYQQGTGMLRGSCDRFCCLGVLCELAVAEGVIPPVRNQAYGEGFDQSQVQLPKSVVEWAFTKKQVKERGYECFSDPMIGDYSASHWNDNLRRDFGQIANLIEEHL